MNHSTSNPVNPDPRRPNQNRARFWLGRGLPAAILTASYIPFLLLRSELPNRVASHYDGAGRPDNSMTVGAFLVVTSLLVVVGLGLTIELSKHRRVVVGAQGVTVGFLGPFVAALGGGILTTTAVSQRGLDNWKDAPNVWWSLPIVFAGAAVAGIGGAWLGSRLSVAAGDTNPRNVPVMDLSDEEMAVWTTSLRSSPLSLLGAALVVAGIALFATTPPWMGIILLISSVPLFALATVNVRIDRNGMQVKYGRLPWPTTRISVDRIDTASTIEVRPSEWGGWGYRGSLKLMRQAAVVHRAGPGIRLDLKDGKIFVVTVDDPQIGVALLNAQVKRGVIAK